MTLLWWAAQWSGGGTTTPQNTGASRHTIPRHVHIPDRRFWLDLEFPAYGVDAFATATPSSTATMDFRARLVPTMTSTFITEGRTQFRWTLQAPQFSSRVTPTAHQIQTEVRSLTMRVTFTALRFRSRLTEKDR